MSTPAFCTKCNINWASVPSQDDDSRDETYEYCPTCKSDMDLTDVKDGDKFIFNLLDGSIKNVKTGELLIRNKISVPVPKPEFDKELYKVKKVMREHYQEKRLDVYHDVFEKHGKEAAEKAYSDFSEQDYLTLTETLNV